MSDQYIPMIERISEEYDESDSNMVLELADTDQGYAALKQQMSELKHQYPFIEKLLEGDGEIRLYAQEQISISGCIFGPTTWSASTSTSEATRIVFPIWRKLQHSKKNNQHGNSEADWRNPVGFFHASPLYIVSHPKRTANLRLWKGGYFYALLRLGSD